jgi:adenylate cyclase class IV
MHNLELKVRCPDDAALDAIEATARARGAVYLRAMYQRDTYFAAPRGRLKLREWRREDEGPAAATSGDDAEAGDHGATLIAYDRPDEAGSRVSDYLLCPVPDPDALRAALARALGVRLVVEKRRRLYRWGHTRIHLDRVADLGPFVELETVVEHFQGTPDERQAAAEAEHRRVIALLGLDLFTAIAGSYSDLLAAPG